MKLNWDSIKIASYHYILPHEGMPDGGIHILWESDFGHGEISFWWENEMLKHGEDLLPEMFFEKLFAELGRQIFRGTPQPGSKVE